MAGIFSAAELEELRRADEEIDNSFSLTQEDLEFSRGLDREAKFDRLDNREKWNAYMRDYRRKKREAQKKAAPVLAHSDGWWK